MNRGNRKISRRGNRHYLKTRRRYLKTRRPSRKLKGG